ncbi:hypothetical protein EJD97_001144 [Solanum chilense]|uniref:Uncharacterized protein n=1 Tax=Solanum chilense TaxID=4083 RepID=A0A6N2BYB4_SOLCI|nr:hypothetical protein EJD97_001144 [Solanum chilense]
MMKIHRSDFGSGSDHSILLLDLEPRLLPSPVPVLYPFLELVSLGKVPPKLLARFNSARFITSFRTPSGNLRVYRSKFSPGSTSE